MRKIWTILLVFALNFCFMAGCQNKGYIPDGKYAETLGSNVFMRHEGDSRIEFYWEIDGDKAEYYASAALVYKCNVLEKDGKIYFEGYTWKNMFSSVESGAVFEYEVLYDETTQSITVLW